MSASKKVGNEGLRSSSGKNIVDELHTTAMITEEQFRHIGEDLDPMPALLGMNVTLRREVHRERARVNEVVVSQNTEDIESLKKQIDEKNKEITVLQKAMKNSKSKTKS